MLVGFPIVVVIMFPEYFFPELLPLFLNLPDRLVHVLVITGLLFRTFASLMRSVHTL